MQGNTAEVIPARPRVACPTCRTVVFDGEVVLSRVVRVLAQGCEAKCKQCREWVAVPLRYQIGAGR